MSDKKYNWYCEEEDCDIVYIILDKSYDELRMILEKKRPDIPWKHWRVRVADEGFL